MIGGQPHPHWPEPRGANRPPADVTTIIPGRDRRWPGGYEVLGVQPVSICDK